MKDKMQKSMDQAAGEFGGLTAAAALCVLAKEFGVFVDEMTLYSGIGISIPDTDKAGMDGAAQTAYAGAGQFLAVAARLKGLSREETLLLCRKWKQCFQDWKMQSTQRDKPAAEEVRIPEEWFLDTLMLAYDFTGSRRELLGLGDKVAKPQKNYDSIYENRESMFQHSPYALEVELTKAVAKGDSRKALKALRKITAQGEKAVLAKDPLRSAKNSMIGSIAFLARAAIQAGVSADHAFSLSDALTQQIEDMRSKNAVLAFEENILLQYVELVRQRLAQSYSVPVMRVIHYIENRLDQKVLLEEAAAYAGVHAAYLSARFKKETGLSFSYYISMRKIQESSYFVRHTDYSVSQIAYLYGFSSQSYYITLFKKVMEMTPMEYRRRFLAE
ncbi:MAG: helix-turn-helix transcriptional regulator [Lachnospiraceae bacterium]|nr:helix-turn-helix transcriptional regulator [Lachnospiraceae bacterium]